MREKLSAVVVSYNRALLIGTCVRALGFADEVIVVDKSSTDGTAEIASKHADRVITVPWSPTVEETRAFAVAQCTHDWIICLDDDECLSPDAIRFIRTELEAPQAEVYGLLQRHYILGSHDEAAYYWPEHQIRMFRRGSVTFSSTVHGGTEVHSDNVLHVPEVTGAAILHLSHQDVAQWIEKTNRYTSRLDRERVHDHGRSLVRFAHERIDHWLSQTRDTLPGGYPEAVSLLRATYDLIDRLKIWEEERGLNAAVEFNRVCAELDAAYAALGVAKNRAGEIVTAKPYVPRAVDEHEVLRRRLAHFRVRHDALTAERDAQAAEATRLGSELQSVQEQQQETRRALESERERAELAEVGYTRAQAEAIIHREQAAQAEKHLGALKEDVDQLQSKSLALQSALHTLQTENAILQRENATLQSENAILQGSLRHFMRAYLPRLRQHLFGQRP
jgi:glycosyltransferase involved in cell wall biosynthesis